MFLAALHHFVFEEPQSVPGDGYLRMDCVFPQLRMNAVPQVKLKIHSQFHQI